MPDRSSGEGKSIIDLTQQSESAPSDERDRAQEEALDLATKPRRAEGEVLQGEALHEMILKTAMDGFWQADGEGRIVEVNDSYCRMSGYTREELLGKPISELEANESADDVKPHIDKITAQGEDRFESRHRRKDGSIFDVEVNVQYRAEFGKRRVAFFRDITDRKRAEEALRRSEEKYRVLFESSRDAVMTLAPSSWVFTSGNPATVRLFRTHDEAHFTSLGPWDISPERQPDGRLSVEKARDMIETAMREGSHFFEWTHRRLSGEEFPATVLLTRMEPDGQPLLQATVRDISERKQAEEALKQAHDVLERRVEQRTEELMRVNEELQTEIAERKRAEEATEMEHRRLMSVLDSIPYGIYLADQEHNLQYINPVVERDFGPIDGRKCYAYFQGRADVCPWCKSEEVFAGKSVQWEWHSPTTNKHYLLFDSPFTNQDGSVARLDLFQDITALKQAEEERRKLESKMQQVQRLESLGVLAGGIAHDFNNLLCAILGNAELAQVRASGNAPIRGNLEDIRAAAETAADLCRQLLAYAGKGRFVVEPLDLSKVVEESKPILSISPAKKAILTFNLDHTLPAVQADRSQIQQVVMNLVINASEALSDQGGAISVSTGTVDCDREYMIACHGDVDEISPGKYVYLEVSDTGCGMDTATHSRIFEPFFTTKFVGRGLGMSAVLGIVRSQKGAIWIDSEVGRGTTVRVLLPASLTMAATRSVIEQAPTGATRWHGTVLVVDDEPLVLKMASEMLTLLGFDVQTALGGREALETVSQHATGMCLILLDLSMPDMDGAETFRQLQFIKPGVRVVVSSGYTEQECSRHFEWLSVAGFLQKPYRLEALKAKLREVLGE